MPPKFSPVTMLPEDIAAFGYSLDNHSKMMAQFAFGFTSLFGVLNSGSIVGLLAFASTDLGGNALSENFADFKFVAYLFGAGFLCASGVMVAIFFYSNNKYLHYRNILRGKTDVNVATEFRNLYAIGWILCVIMLISTFGGLNYSLDLMVKANSHRKNSQKAAFSRTYIYSGYVSGKALVTNTIRTASKT